LAFAATADGKKVYVTNRKEKKLLVNYSVAKKIDEFPSSWRTMGTYTLNRSWKNSLASVDLTEEEYYFRK
jgi:hypothetical protein